MAVSQGVSPNRLEALGDLQVQKLGDYTKIQQDLIDLNNRLWGSHKKGVVGLETFG